MKTTRKFYVEWKSAGCAWERSDAQYESIKQAVLYTEWVKDWPYTKRRIVEVVTTEKIHKV